MRTVPKKSDFTTALETLAKHYAKNKAAARRIIPERLNDKGQCPICKKKPLEYRREAKKWCSRCSRTFNFNTGVEIIDLTFGVRPGARFQKKSWNPRKRTEAEKSHLSRKLLEHWKRKRRARK